MDEISGYGLSGATAGPVFTAPVLNYRPPSPRDYRPRIGLIGAGGISEYHLRAYQKNGWEVAAIADRTLSKAQARANAFAPSALVTTDFRWVLENPDIDVIDATPHPRDRMAIIEAALNNGKHVLSQKPFVDDLADGEKLIRLAEEKGLKLAVNHNGRWAPHFSYMAAAVRAGVIGEVASIDFILHWDHTWTAGTRFEDMKHLLLLDFGIHWFDMATVLMGGALPERVYASVQRTSFQVMKPPFLASVIADYPGTQARLNFNAHVTDGQEDRTIIAGSKGTLRASGPGLNSQRVTLWTAQGEAPVPLEGCWFDSGFEGAMGELLCAIEDDREPANSARSSLRSLAFCKAALESADGGGVISTFGF
ncbi:MAG: gfo/Idh/MocA family oxidoreductase [Verrucomicrobiaceae bacterium]|nr:gfo/Idh/MocA family oxidoreductase [Verrucomicrobiaceae bacterium]MDB6118510.1 gfo/Idh/MocA family oxidoreductase [Verrucomicrobiaceae bacterium]